MRAAILLGPLAVWSCGGKSSNSQTQASLSQSDFPAAYASAICDAIILCCGQSQTIDRSACVTSLTSEGQRVLDAGVTTGTYNGAKAAACVEQVRSILSQCNLPSNYQSQVTTACEWIYDGNSPAGGPCGVDQDCVAPPNGTPRCIGQCVSDTPGQLGDICGSAPDPSAPLVTHTGCASGLYCGATLHCTASSSEGAACTYDQQCAASLYCDQSSGKCQPTLALGAPCVVTNGIILNSPCGAGQCDQGVCSPAPTSSLCDAGGPAN